MALIPQHFHYVWFGECISKKYLEKLHHARKINPEYDFTLHIAPETMTATTLWKLHLFCRDNKIKLANIHQQALPNTEIINHYLKVAETEKSKSSRQIRAYTQASDIARAAILFKRGGIYCDFDVNHLKPMPNLTAEHDVRLLDGIYIKNRVYGLAYQEYVTGMDYSFLASSQGSKYLETVLALQKQDFDYLHLYDKNTSFLDSLYRFIIYCTTSLLTVSQHQHAINWLHQTKQIEDLSDVYIDLTDVLQHEKNEPWIGYSAKANDGSEKIQLQFDAFREFKEELSGHRAIYFPVTAHEDIYDFDEGSILSDTSSQSSFGI